MMEYLFLSLFAVALALSSPAKGQLVIEVEKSEPSEDYLKTIKAAEDIRTQSTSEAIRILQDGLPRTKTPSERFGIIFEKMSFLYAEEGRFHDCLEILRKGQEEGLFYPLLTEPRKWPEYMDSLAAVTGFKPFSDKNSALRKEAQKDGKCEYTVHLPTGYTTARKFPLLIVLHGGFGSHIELPTNWHSPKLDTGFVVAFVQGTEFLGSYLRSYQQGDQANIATAYHQVVQKYSIDTSRVVLGGGSAGGARAIMLSLDEYVPAAGLILAFPMRPRELDSLKLAKVANAGLRAAFLCGENDRAIKVQKEMGVIFDKHNIANRFIVASGLGHEFPADFTKEIDLSLDFILKTVP